MNVTGPDQHAPAADPVEPDSAARRGMGTARNMALSMVVVVGFVLVLLAFVPRPQSAELPAVDVRLAGQQVVRQTGWPIAEPRDLPSGWKATSVRFTRSTDGLQTWHAGYLTPGGQQYVALEQTRGATAAWLKAETAAGVEQGATNVGGASWQKLTGEGDRRSLVQRGPTDEALTTVVSGTGSFAQLTELAERLRPITVPSG